MLRARYKMLEGNRRGPGGPAAHRDSSEVVEVQVCFRIRARFRQFRRGAAEGNDGFPTIEDELAQFLWLGYFSRRAESLELNSGASNDL
jgi:hypothetical protein